MNRKPVKGSSHEEDKKSGDDADKVAEKETARNKGKAGKRGSKNDTVLGEINDS